MGLETGTYINSLDSANPASGDSQVQGDDHIRLIKATVKATFPNLTGAVTPTQTELNYVDGVTSSIQDQIDAANAARVAGDALMLPKAGGTMTGALVLSGSPSAALEAAPKQYADLMLPKAGGMMTGQIKAVGDPVADEDLARKAYVDDAVANAITNTFYEFSSGIGSSTCKYVAHGLDLALNEIIGIQVLLQCTSADQGYSIGDRTPAVSYITSGVYRFVNVAYDATYLIMMPYVTDALSICPKPVYPSTVGSIADINMAKWKVVALVTHRAL